jgi:hypothetical protein
MAEHKFSPFHPGEILLAEFPKLLGLSQCRLAKDIGVPPVRKRNYPGQARHQRQHRPGPCGRPVSGYRPSNSLSTASVNCRRLET